MNRQIILAALLVTALFLTPGTSRARLYNVNTGRFQTLDTYAGNNEDPLSLHKYLYAADDPINRIDPSGHQDTTTELAAEDIDEEIESDIDVVYEPARESATFRILQSAALFAFLADEAGLFDPDPVGTITKDREENPDSMVFLHATSTGAWPELAEGGLPVINPNLGANTDFGLGFYTFNASSADPRVIPSAIQRANQVASRDGGTPVVTIWLMNRAKYNSLTKYDFSALSDADYSSQVGDFRAGRRLTTGSQVAFGEIAKYNGSAWVRNLNLPFQYKFEGYSGVSGLRSFGGFSPEPLH